MAISKLQIDQKNTLLFWEIHLIAITNVCTVTMKQELKVKGRFQYEYSEVGVVDSAMLAILHCVQSLCDSNLTGYVVNETWYECTKS